MSAPSTVEVLSTTPALITEGTTNDGRARSPVGVWFSVLPLENLLTQMGSRRLYGSIIGTARIII